MTSPGVRRNLVSVVAMSDVSPSIFNSGVFKWGCCPRAFLAFPRGKIECFLAALFHFEAEEVGSEMAPSEVGGDVAMITFLWRHGTSVLFVLLRDGLCADKPLVPWRHKKPPWVIRRWRHKNLASGSNLSVSSREPVAVRPSASRLRKSQARALRV